MQPPATHQRSWFLSAVWLFIFHIISTHQSNVQTTSLNGGSNFVTKGKTISRGKRVILKDPARLWTKGVLPYTFDDSMDESAIREVKVAMTVYEYYTPIRFVPKADIGVSNELGHQAYVEFIKKRRTCIHEIGHVLGFSHEIAHPDRNQWVRMNWNSMPHVTLQGPFWQERDMSILHASPYDLSSFMHYEPWNYPRMGPRFDILFSELKVNKRIFYMFKELCKVYKCHEFPQCRTNPPTCHNEGYVSVVNGKCACVCIPVFNPETQCATLFTSASHSRTMPTGMYSLPRHGDNVCPTGMASLLLNTPIGNTAKGLSICQHPCADCQGKNWDWPRGTYCFLTVHASCPAHKDIRQSSLSYFTTDRIISTLTFCCLEIDLARDAVEFNVRTPFSLFMHYERTCQQFIGFRVEERAIGFDANTTTITEGPFTSKDGDTLNIYACDYTPVDRDCGVIIDLLTAEFPSVTIMADWKDASNKDCTWVIKGPAEKGAMVLNFEEFSNVRKDGDECIDAVEVMNVRLGQPGIRYCGDPVRHSIRSVYNNMTVLFQTGGNSKATFKATVTWKPAKNWCYNLEDNGLSYAGPVNYTRRFKACLPWLEASKCFHNPYTESDRFHTLEDNACRNPDNGLRPWCYTEVGLNFPGSPFVNCRRDFCDVCHLDKPYDKMDDCESLKQKGSCTKNITLAVEDCAKTCDIVSKQDVEKVSTIHCPSPGSISNSDLVNGRESYTVGDTVTYTCKRNKHFTIERICLTTGKWSVANTACTECPVGFRLEHGKCYGFVNKWVPYQDAVDACNNMGASIVSVAGEWENTLIHGLMPAGIELMWLGGRVRGEGGQEVGEWEDGTPFTYTNWKRKYSVPKEKMNIAMRKIYAQWDARLAKNWLPFVCKLDSAVDPDCLDVVEDCQVLLGKSDRDACKKYSKIRNYCRRSCGLCS